MREGALSTIPLYSSKEKGKSKLEELLDEQSGTIVEMLVKHLKK